MPICFLEADSIVFEKRISSCRLHNEGLLSDSLKVKTNRNTLSILSQELADLIARLLPHDGALQTAVPGLTLYHRNAPVASACQVYEPALAVVAQGAKAVEVGSEMFSFNERSWLLTPLHVPATSRITEARPEKPYLACTVRLDMQAAREMILELEAVPGDGPAAAPCNFRSNCDCLRRDG